MMKFFTTLLFFGFLSVSLCAQQKKTNSYAKKPVLKSAKKTTNLPAPTAYRNVAKPLSFNGQWKGGFVDNSASFIGFGGEKIDYVLELEISGSKVLGYSYTYFTEGAKRYYTICKIRGTVNKATKEVVVTEYERTKYNTPPEMSNCFQTHKLKYVKESLDSEILQGSWIPAPNQNANCGYGTTILSRRIIKRTPLSEQKAYVPAVKKTGTVQTKPLATDQKKKTETASRLPAAKTNAVKNSASPKKDTVKKEVAIIKPPVKNDAPVIKLNLKFDQRINTVLKTIPITTETFKVDFYDNGEIDGDSISVFYNGNLVLSHKRLTNKPITLTLTIDPGITVNELVMYAENLGEIPPNTALMIVQDGNNRYEARITSDTQKNGTIRFSYKPNVP